MKRTMVESVREVCGSVPRNMGRNDVVKAVVERKEAAWKEIWI